MKTKMDSEIWGPHYWFVLHTIAFNYPENVNEVTRRKYYDFIQNLPLFIPVPEMGDKFATLLDRYPVTPYLATRDSFIRWMYFIHNKYNEFLGKEQITFGEGIERYLDNYKPKPVIISEKTNITRHIIYSVLIFVLLFLIYVFYK